MFQVGTENGAPTTTPANTPAGGQTTEQQVPSLEAIEKMDKNSAEYRNAILARTAHQRALAAGNNGVETPAANTEETTEETPTEEPKLILGKFKTQADLEKAYTELQKKLGQGGAKAPKAGTEGTPAAGTEGGETEETPGETEGEPEGSDDTPDFEALGNEFRDNNMDLTAETKEKLSKKFGKDVVETHLAGLRAQVELARYKVCEAAGVSVTEATELVQWAASGLSKGEQAMFNKGAAGSQEEAVAALQWLKEKHLAANGKQPTRVIAGGNAGTQGTQGFNSKAEMVDAMRDARYGRDAGYTQAVQARILATSAANKAR